MYYGDMGAYFQMAQEYQSAEVRKWVHDWDTIGREQKEKAARERESKDEEIKGGDKGDGDGEGKKNDESNEKGKGPKSEKDKQAAKEAKRLEKRARLPETRHYMKALPNDTLDEKIESMLRNLNEYQERQRGNAVKY